MATATALLSAEEFGELPDPGYLEELVRGRVVPLPIPGARHGQICGRFVFLLGRFLEDRDLGHALCNNAGFITERNPDTVRGPDISFYSYDRMPKGPLPTGYPDIAPELAIEVLSPDDRWPNVLAKVAEYLNAGVLVTCVLDDDSRIVQRYTADQPVRLLGPNDDLTFPEVLGDFRVPVRRFFE